MGKVATVTQWDQLVKVEDSVAISFAAGYDHMCNNMRTDLRKCEKFLTP